MRKYVLLLSVVSSACSPGSEGTGENIDLGATGTTFDSEGGSSSGGSGTSTGEEPDIPTTGGGSTGGEGGGGETTGDAAMCGDGVVEGDEICDDGFEGNQPENMCTPGCIPAKCGDAYVQPSNGETCDDGAFNAAMPGYGQCSTSCVRESFCGDGVVQIEAGEECEPGGGGDGENCGAMCKLSPRLVFVTSAVFSGNMGGLAGADKHCNEAAAMQPGITGTYRAWLMVDGQSIEDRFPEFVEPVAWNFTNTSAGLLAKSFAELVAEGPAQPVAFTEAGDEMPMESVWTGITKDGVAAGGDCAQWTSEAGTAALIGYSGYLPNVGPDALKWKLERQWTDIGFKKTCNKKHPIYCLQVAD